MAQRYGGDFSPQFQRKSQKQQSPKREPAGARSNVLFTPAIVVAATSLGKGAGGLALGLGSAAFLTLGAWLLREGLRAEATFHDRKLARRPAIPRKLFSAVAFGIGAGLAAFRNDGDFLASGIYAAIAGVLTLAAFGLDPLKDKVIDGIDTHAQDRVARAVEGAEAHIQSMKDAISTLRDRSLENRVSKFAQTAQDLFRTVEDDPRDLVSARKYLSVYLQGARDATAAFVDIYQRNGDKTARSDYLALLDDLDQNFAARTQKLLVDNRTDLTIEIDVLRDRLARETR